jgi:hypothetical protein
MLCMAKYEHGMAPITQPDLQKLFVNWLIYLLNERYGVGSRGSSGPSEWSIQLANEDHTFQVKFDQSGRAQVQGPPVYKEALAELVEDAHNRTLALDYFGTGAWWKASFTATVEIGVTMLHFMRLMHEHNPRRFVGDWRLGNDALVSFQQGNMEATPVSIPKFDVHIIFRAPGPGPGPIAEEAAQRKGTFVRAAISFATAAPLIGSPPLFSANDDEIEVTKAKLLKVNELPAEIVGMTPLWPQIMALMPDEDSKEAVLRAQGAIFAYEQAMRQESEYVTIALLVSALEALSVPNAKWQKEKLTKRFLQFVPELCSDAVQEVTAHGNFAEVFGLYTSNRRFLDELYSQRSRPLHTGFLQHQISALPFGGGHLAGIRVMLVSGLVREGIVKFLQRPFSSLIGHPSNSSSPSSFRKLERLVLPR